MSMKTLVLAAVSSVALMQSAMAQDIQIMDAYARSSGPMAKAGAAFMHIMNTGTSDDRLIDAKSSAAKKVELHTHIDMGDGVMKMTHVPEGFSLPAGEAHMLQRGGDHVMFMGLTAPFEQGKLLDVTLVFERAGEIEVQIPVDLERKATHSMNH